MNHGGIRRGSLQDRQKDAQRGKHVRSSPIQQDGMTCTFPKVELTDAQRIWLAEVYRRYRYGEDLNERAVKLALHGKLPPRFKSSEINGSLICGTSLTLLGIWHVDPDSDVFAKADRVIRAVRTVIENDAAAREVTAGTAAQYSGLPENEASEILRLICLSGDMYGRIDYRRKEDGSSECTVDVSSESVFDEYMEYMDLTLLMQTLYSRYTSGPKNHVFPSMEAPVTSPEAEDIIRDTAFILMRIDPKNPDLEDVLNAIKDVCRSFGIKAIRADEIEHQEQITDVIRRHIGRAEFLIADLTNERPNVYYEVGYAHALGKRPVLIRKSETTVHFDLAGYNIREYPNATQLKMKLHKAFMELTSRQPKDSEVG